MIAAEATVFLRGTPPFDALPQPMFDQAARQLEVVERASGTLLAQSGGEPLQHLYVIRRGSVRLERDGHTLQVLEEGETFGYTSLITGHATLDVVVEEDLQACRIPADVFRSLLADARFAGHFAVGLSERLRASLDRAPVAALGADLARSVLHLVRRPAVWIAPEATVGEAARVMRRERISSLLVRTEPPGIVTDRDFRSRVLAEDRGPSTRVAEVLSRPLRLVQAETPIYEAWRALLDGAVHHLPVTQGDEIVGVLTSTDLVRFTPHSPVAFLQRIERLGSRNELPGYSAKATEMVSALLGGGLDPLVIGSFVARVNDVVLQRILAWAEADLGPPPAPYAWIVFGSEGRREQTLLTDQDNALVYADEGAAHRAWFQSFADLVNRDLEAAGFPACPGGYMGRNWHGPLREWTERFTGWIDVPTPQAMLVASIFFDLRKVHGGLDLAPLERALARSAASPFFLRELARDALHFRPPPLLLLRLRGGSSLVDLKNHALRPIVSLARCFGLQASAHARGTVERLDAAARAGFLEAGTSAIIAEAYRFLLGLRLRQQLQAAAGATPAPSKVALADLTAIERSRLKDCFRAILSWQDMAAQHFHVDR